MDIYNTILSIMIITIFSILTCLILIPKLKDYIFKNNLRKQRDKLFKLNTKEGMNKLLNENKIIVSMTTSPKRMLLMKPVIESILNQTHPPNLIRINIPKIFKRTNQTYSIPSFISGNPKIKVYTYDEDYGPIMKILPTLIEYKNDNDKIIIYGDDDVLMLPKMIENYLDFILYNPSNVYCLSGMNIRNNKITEANTDNKFINRADIAEGYMSVCLKSNIINKSFMDYYNLVKQYKDCFQSDDLIISNFFGMNKLNRFVIYTETVNRKIWWKSGCELKHGKFDDALQNINIGGHVLTYLRVCDILKKNNLYYVKNDNIVLFVRSYNRPIYLQNTIKSIKKSNIECVKEVIIFDDCSNDLKTIELLKEYENTQG